MNPRPRLVIASLNRAKSAEITRILRREGLEFDLIALADLPPIELPLEDAATFSANAAAKATHVARATGLPVVADDSGLQVHALGGQPGIRSARYAGDHATDEDRNQKLLHRMQGLPDDQRRARFHCAAAFATPHGDLLVTEEVCEGKIAPAPAGHHGFGYDPVFIPDGYTCTMAQLTPAQKDAISHRGQAFRALAKLIRERLQR